MIFQPGCKKFQFGGKVKKREGMQDPMVQSQKRLPAAILPKVICR